MRQRSDHRKTEKVREVELLRARLSKLFIYMTLLSSFVLVGCEDNTTGVKDAESSFATIFWVSYFIGCVISGIICAAIMSSKGHDGTSSWFFLGLLLGIIGIIIAACQPNLYYINSLRNSQNSTSSSSLNNNKGTWVCKCGTRNNSDDSFCYKCGKRNLNSSAKNDGSWKCKCGAMNYSYETSCHRCGEKKPFDSKTNATTSSSPLPTQKSMTEQLEELKKMLDQGLITQEDFDAKKKQLLGL